MQLHRADKSIVDGSGGGRGFSSGEGEASMANVGSKRNFDLIVKQKDTAGNQKKTLVSCRMSDNGKVCRRKGPYSALWICLR